MPIRLFVVMVSLVLSQSLVAKELTKKSPNILFIAVDDLRPSLGVYGDALVKSPNIDTLASEGTVFTRTFTSVPTCGATRASLLTGLRPTSKRFLTHDTRIEKEVPNSVTLPLHFKNNGYHAVSLGKVAHFKDDVANHWSENPWGPEPNVNYQLAENQAITKKNSGKSHPYEIADLDETIYKDALIAKKAIEKLGELSKSAQPFFLAVGFARPHMPFSVPKSYWDLYPAEKIVLPNNYFRPRNVPDQAMHDLFELRKYHDVPQKGPISDELALTLIHGYYASVTFVDAQIGKLLQALKESDAAQDTIVILWGDHGWQLGEHKLWHKHSNFKVAMHSPLIIKVPGKTKNQKARGLTEFVDIFPTLCDLAGLPKPSHLQGESVASYLDKPDEFSNTTALSQWEGGTTLFTEQHAYTEWFDKDGKNVANMLFDHAKDPDENVNIADHPENKRLIKELSTLLNKKRLAIK